MRITRPVVAVTGLLILVAAVIATVAVRGLAADDPPGVLETTVARRLVVLSIPLAARRATNPLGAEADSWRAGAGHFDEHCAVCHGAGGHGSAIGRAMYPPVPDLAGPEVQGLSDGALFAIIQHGVRWTGMPAFRATHTPEELWQLVAFVRRLPHGREAPHETDVKAHDAGAQGTVVMDGTAFHPAEITVAAGSVITWRNEDPFPHTVVSTSGGWRSGDLPPDAIWQWKATTPGTFPYVCTLHPGMSGIVHVR